MNSGKSGDELIALLEKNGLKKTKARLGILHAINEHNTALSQPELEKLIGDDIDRVTLYRALKTFEETGILHKIVNLQGTANYAMCSDSSCTHEGHHDQHLHFNCTVCLKVYCLEQYKVPTLILPEDFLINSLNLIAYGVCGPCNKAVS